MKAVSEIASPISRKLLAVTVLLVLAVTGASLLSIYCVIWPAFLQLEREDARFNIGRVLEGIDGELDVLDRQTRDYATWDDAYRFMLERGQTFLDTLTDTSLVTTGMNLYAIYDTAGTLVWKRGLDINTMQPLEFQAFSTDRPADDPMIAFGEASVPYKGIRRTEHGPVLVAARPILTGNGDGPMRGVFVVGRLLTADVLASIRQRTKVDFTLDGVDRDDLAQEARTAIAALRDRKVQTIDERDEGAIHSYALLGVLDRGEPLFLRVDTPRDVTRLGRTALLFAGASILVAGLLMALASVILFQRLIVAPLRSLTDFVLHVGRHGALKTKSGIVRRDEIGALARQFETTNAQLDDARQALMAQSFNNGMAEMAAGVLHNIRNTLTPVGIAVWLLSEQLRRPMAQNLERAIKELEDGPAPDRREKLARYVKEAVRTECAARGAMLKQLGVIEDQIRQTDRILQDHAAQEMGRRILELVEVDVLAAEAARTLLNGSPIRYTVQSGPTIIATVMAHRVVLFQVIDNILVNAMTAMKDMTGRELKITLSLDNPEPGTLRLKISDNGRGIADDVLPRLFERGFSTKKTGAGGLGLHWCANSLRTMGGRIEAESAGSDQGATFSIFLPTASREAAAAAPSPRSHLEVGA